MKKLIILSLVLLMFSACRSNINIEAKIIYNMGGPQPVARQNIYLVNYDVLALTPTDPQWVKLKETTDEEKFKDLSGKMALLSLLKTGIDQKALVEGKEKNLLGAFEFSKPAWQSFIVAETQTDFDGKAEIKDVPPGKYWLLAQTETRSAFTLWDLPVDISRGDNKILLDQNNALYSK